MTDAHIPALGVEAGGRSALIVEDRDDAHHAPQDTTTTMSEYGLQKDASLIDPLNIKLHSEDFYVNPFVPTNPTAPTALLSPSTRPELLTQPQKLHSQIRLHFADFAKQLRVRRHHAHKQYQLAGQRKQLEQAINLSERLSRVGSWTHDGLVEIVGHADPASFAHVHQHMQDLSDICFSQWKHDIHSKGTTLDFHVTENVQHEAASFLSNLSLNAQNDLLELLTMLRSKPRFLVERFKALSTTQIQTLYRGPRFEDVPDSIITSLSQSRGRMSQKKRLQTYSKGLEEYASSFERSNPLFFLMHNIYSATSLHNDHEKKLRYHTWSSICADLLQEAELHYSVLLNQVLASFAGIKGWRVKERLELFLMDVLQRGAFLLDDGIGGSSSSGSNAASFDYLMTDQARIFFDEAVKDLFKLLSGPLGAFPAEVGHLARHIIAKLPTIESQSRFRGDFFHWFLQEYLRIAITYPENERLLLQFHVSKRARDKILFQLWHQAQYRALDVFSESPSREVDPNIRFYVESMVAQLGPAETCGNPYDTFEALPSSTSRDIASSTAVIVVCPSDVVHLLEALSPQSIRTSGPWDPFIGASTSAFQAQYSAASNKFDRLRREILLYTEPGSSPKNVHPSQEQWVSIQIDKEGKPIILPFEGQNLTFDEHVIFVAEPIDEVQKAVIRLASPIVDNEKLLEDNIEQTLSLTSRSSILDLFEEQAQIARDNADGVSTLFWARAITKLRKRYPLSVFTKNDTRILQSLVKVTAYSHDVLVKSCAALDNEVNELESAFERARSKIELILQGLDRLRLKLWYQSDVVSSDIYEGARGITSALLHMALPDAFTGGSDRILEGKDSRPTSSASSSSIFKRHQSDAMSILKAPPEYGGPRKLSDTQVDLTKKWLQRNSVDNFCRSEERIHRFCMEVKTTTKKLIAESLAESPVLWSSELFGRERQIYEGGSASSSQAYPSTRPPSMVSDTMLPSVHQLRNAIRSNDSGSRAGIIEGPPTPARKASFHSLGSSKINKDLLGSDLASSFGSRSRAVSSRAVSATTAESLTSIFTPLSSNPHSITSISTHSRPASVFNDIVLSRPIDIQKQKSAFLESLQHNVVCLLLSDLGCPVWSLGSETDAWLERFRDDPLVAKRLDHRLTTEGLLSPMRRYPPVVVGKKIKASAMRRSASAGGAESQIRPSSVPRAGHIDVHRLSPTGPGKPEEFWWPEAMQGALAKVSHFTDPVQKLQAVQDFRSLALAQLVERAKEPTKPISGALQSSSELANRRQSLNAVSRKDKALDGDHHNGSYAKGHLSGDENPYVPMEPEIVHRLKVLLYQLKPKTLFRDLQYIAAFVPSDTLNKTESGRAFFQVGLAALAYKEEVCHSMVDVADGLAAHDMIKRRTSSVEQKDQPLSKAAEYWIHAAREGNAIAQRELASLYLTHPRIVPITSVALSASSETFKAEMMWEKSNRSRENWQALCLALHWMQQAAWNGDKVAQEKLREREDSLR